MTGVVGGPAGSGASQLREPATERGGERSQAPRRNGRSAPRMNDARCCGPGSSGGQGGDLRDDRRTQHTFLVYFGLPGIQSHHGFFLKRREAKMPLSFFFLQKKDNGMTLHASREQTLLHFCDRGRFTKTSDVS